MTLPDIPFALRKIDHIVLKALDVSNMAEFYITVLGCTLEREVAGAGLLQLRAGECLIDIIDAQSDFALRTGSPPNGDSPTVDHICLRVQPWDDEAILSHLTSHSVRFGQIELRYGADGHGPSLYLQDPENNWIELKG